MGRGGRGNTPYARVNTANDPRRFIQQTGPDSFVFTPRGSNLEYSIDTSRDTFNVEERPNLRALCLQKIASLEAKNTIIRRDVDSLLAQQAAKVDKNSHVIQQLHEILAASANQSGVAASFSAAQSLQDRSNEILANRSNLIQQLQSNVGAASNAGHSSTAPPSADPVAVGEVPQTRNGVAEAGNGVATVEGSEIGSAPGVSENQSGESPQSASGNEVGCAVGTRRSDRRKKKPNKLSY